MNDLCFIQKKNKKINCVSTINQSKQFLTFIFFNKKILSLSYTHLSQLRNNWNNKKKKYDKHFQIRKP